MTTATESREAAPPMPASRTPASPGRETAASSLPPVHPGEILLEEFLKPMGLSQYRLAKDTSVPPRRINEIVHGKRAVTADTALRLARFFGNDEMFWLNLQVHHDLEQERERLGDRLAREVKPWEND